MNDGIDKPMSLLKYITVDEIVENVKKCSGRGALLEKLDKQSAFRTVPVHPDDRHLLGILWEDELFMDASLSFGLRSAPKIFNARRMRTRVTVLSLCVLPICWLHINSIATTRSVRQ